MQASERIHQRILCSVLGILHRQVQVEEDLAAERPVGLAVWNACASGMRLVFSLKHNPYHYIMQGGCTGSNK